MLVRVSPALADKHLHVIVGELLPLGLNLRGLPDKISWPVLRDHALASLPGRSKENSLQILKARNKTADEEYSLFFQDISDLYYDGYDEMILVELHRRMFLEGIPGDVYDQIVLHGKDRDAIETLIPYCSRVEEYLARKRSEAGQRIAAV